MNDISFKRNGPKKEFKSPNFSAQKNSHRPARKPLAARPAPMMPKFNQPAAEKSDLSLDAWLAAMDLPEVGNGRSMSPVGNRPSQSANKNRLAPEARRGNNQPAKTDRTSGNRPAFGNREFRRNGQADGQALPPRAKNGNYQAVDSRQKAKQAGNNARSQYRNERASTTSRPNAKPEMIIEEQKPGEARLRVIPIGGYEEVGRNMTIFEYGSDIVIIDMGIMFPEEDMPGISYIIPNVDYLKGKEKNVKAVIFSHGHLDHIGAAPILLEKLANPTIVGRPLTLAMIKHRQEDYKKDSAKKLKCVTVNGLQDKFKFGAFEVSFFQVDHSIMDAMGVIIKTPSATVLHPGDWTLEKDKNGKPKLDYTHLAKLPRPTILMLESLGVVDLRESATTEEMQANLNKLITQAPGRTIIGAFSSQLERIGWIITLSEKINKKVALMGYSMKNNVEIAKKLGYIKFSKNTVIKIEEIDRYPENKIVVLCTGSQGEDNAALSRIISGNDKSVKLRKNDTVILSSSIIPGNERTIQRLKDNLYRQCDNVIHGKIMDIHVSGHGNRDDIAYMLKSIKPDYFIPSYANHYMLKEAAKLAVEIGFRPERVFVPDNGSVVEFTGREARMLAQKVPASYVFVDGLGITDMSNVVMRDRQMLAEDGMLVVIATVDGKTGALIQNPDIISRGFVYLKENKRLIEMTRQKVKKILKDDNPLTAPDDNYLKDKIRNEIGKFLFQKTEKRPMILPVIIEV